MQLPRLSASRAGSGRSSAFGALLEQSAVGSAAGLGRVEDNAGERQAFAQGRVSRQASRLSPKLEQEAAPGETPLLGEGGLADSRAEPVESASGKEREKQKRLDDLDALLWDNALGEAEKMGSDSKGEQRDSRKRHKKRAR